MTRHEVIEVLEYYNKWSLDVHLKSLDPRKVRKAASSAILLLKEDKKIIDWYQKMNER